MAIVKMASSNMAIRSIITTPKISPRCCIRMMSHFFPVVLGANNSGTFNAEQLGECHNTCTKRHSIVFLGFLGSTARYLSGKMLRSSP